MNFEEVKQSIKNKDNIVFENLDTIKNVIANLNKDGSELLIAAVESNNYIAAESLLGLGVDPNAKNINGTPAVSCAVVNGYVDIIDLLAKYQSDLRLPDKDSSATPIMMAIEKNKIDSFKKLLECGLDLKTEITQSRTYSQLYTGETRRKRMVNLPQYAACCGSLEILKYLLKFWKENISDWSPINNLLCYAVCSGNIDTIQYLIDAKANVNAKAVLNNGSGDKFEAPAIYYAVNQKTEILELLLANGALNVCASNKLDAIGYAIFCNEPEKLDILLQHYLNRTNDNSYA